MSFLIKPCMTAVGLLAFSLGASAAPLLQVQTTRDGAGTALQAGWDLVNGDRNAASISGVVAGVTITLTGESTNAYGRSNGSDGGKFNAVNHTDGDLDNLLSGGRLTNDGGDLILTLSGLAAGTYDIKTYNHSMYVDLTNALFQYDILLTDANGTSVLKHDNISNTAGNSVTTAALAAPVTTFVSNGTDDIVLKFSPDTVVNNATTDQNTAFNNTSGGDHMTLNGFEVTLVPEPGSLALLGLGGLCLLKRRRRES